MKRRLLISVMLLLAAIVLMITALRYFFLYLATNDYLHCVMYFTWAGLGAFYGALRTKPGRKITTNYANLTN